MGDDNDVLALRDLRPDCRIVIGSDAGQRVFQAFAARRRNIIGSPPELHLRLAPFLAGFVFVQPGEFAVVAFVQGGIAHDRDVLLIKLGKDDVERVLGAFQNAREGNIEFDPVIADHAAGDAGLDHAFFGQVGITPAGEQVEPVPFAFTVAHEHENIVCQRVCHSLGAFPVVR